MTMSAFITAREEEKGREGKAKEGNRREGKRREGKGKEGSRGSRALIWLEMEERKG